MPTRALRDSEVTLIANALHGQYRLLFLTGIYTGFRIGELLSLRWKDISQTRITVERRNMKGKIAGRSVPIHPELRPRLARPSEALPSDRLFPVSRQRAHKVLTDAYKAVGLYDKLGTHCMRKTLAQRVYRASHRDLVMTQRALGHVSVASTQAYLNVAQDAVDNLIMAL